MHKVSVITVTFNCVKSIEKTILSVISQSYSNVEYIVIDGLSNDGTQEVIEKYRDSISYYESSSDSGIYDAMNKALMKMTGDWVIFMNSGDVFYNNDVLKEVFAGKDFHEVAVVYGDHYSKEKASLVHHPIKDPFYEQPLGRYRSMGFHHQATFVRREWALQYPFDLSYRCCADYNMIVTIFKNGGQFYNANTSISIVDGGGGFSDRKRMQQFYEEAKVQSAEKTLSFKYLYLVRLIKLTVRRSFDLAKRLVILLFIIFVCSFGLHAQTVFVSVTGSDLNSGLNENTPVRSIQMALKKGKIVLLKAGEVFYEDLNISQKNLSRYGEGRNPVVCGFRRLVKPHWENVESNIWKLNLLDSEMFSGYPVIGSSMKNNIGCLYEYDKDQVHGRKVQKYSQLKENWDFWQTEKFKKEEVTEIDFDCIYLFLTHNPNNLRLEISVGVNGISAKNANICDVDVLGFGRHGIAAFTNTKIENCKIDIIGGCLQVGSTNYVCLGNGIEFYVSSNIENCHVSGCRIARCYDCGLTIQASGKGQATPKNIIIEGNFINRCCQGWEDFLRNDSNVVYQNCVFRNNVLVDNGNTTGFGYPKDRFKFCQVLGNNVQGNKGMIIENNVFIGGNFYCSGAYRNEYRSNVWKGNQCYLKKGDYLLGNYMGTKDVIRVGVNGNLRESVVRYRKMTGDNTTQFYILSEKKLRKKIVKTVKKYE